MRNGFLARRQPRNGGIDVLPARSPSTYGKRAGRVGGASRVVIGNWSRLIGCEVTGWIDGISRWCDGIVFWLCGRDWTG